MPKTYDFNAGKKFTYTATIYGYPFDGAVLRGDFVVKLVKGSPQIVESSCIPAARNADSKLRFACGSTLLASSKTDVCVSVS